jgi:hypothetical protein
LCNLKAIFENTVGDLYGSLGLWVVVSAVNNRDALLLIDALEITWFLVFEFGTIITVTRES